MEWNNGYRFVNSRKCLLFIISSLRFASKSYGIDNIGCNANLAIDQILNCIYPNAVSES